MSGVRVMVFNATFNNISVISQQSVLLVEYLIASAKKNQLFTFHWGSKINLLSCIGGHLEFQNHIIHLVQIYPEAFQSKVAFNDSVLSEKNDFKNIFTYENLS
jgi:hypothetical protein